MKQTISLAFLTHSNKFKEVLLSSSIIPSFNVFGLSPKAYSTLANKSTVSCTSKGPCILGLIIYMDPVFEFVYNLKSCIPHKAETIQSKNPSGVFLPW